MNLFGIRLVGINPNNGHKLVLTLLLAGRAGSTFRATLPAARGRADDARPGAHSWESI